MGRFEIEIDSKWFKNEDKGLYNGNWNDRAEFFKF